MFCLFKNEFKNARNNAFMYYNKQRYVILSVLNASFNAF